MLSCQLPPVKRTHGSPQRSRGHPRRRRAHRPRPVRSCFVFVCPARGGSHCAESVANTRGAPEQAARATIGASLANHALRLRAASCQGPPAGASHPDWVAPRTQVEASTLRIRALHQDRVPSLAPLSPSPRWHARSRPVIRQLREAWHIGPHVSAAGSMHAPDNLSLSCGSLGPLLLARLRPPPGETTGWPLSRTERICCFSPLARCSKCLRCWCLGAA